MNVIKRNGDIAPVSFDKILNRIDSICNDRNISPNKLNINTVLIAQRTISGLYNNIHTSELDDIAANISASMVTINPEYGAVAARIIVSNHHKNTLYNLAYHFGKSVDVIAKNVYYYTCKAMYENVGKNNEQAPLLSPQVYRYVCEHKDELERLINNNLDYLFDYVGITTLMDSYLTKCSIRIKDNDGNTIVKRVPIERPQHLYMRVALGIHVVGKYVNWNCIMLKHVDFDLFKAVLDEKDMANMMYQYKNGTLDLKYYFGVISAYNRDASHIINHIQKVKLTWTDLLEIEESECKQLYVSQDKGKVSIIDNVDNKYNNIDLINLTQKRIFDTYWLLSNHLGIHATPTLFLAGTLRPQCSSCFLVALPDDSIDGIADYWKECGLISKYAGGLGSSISNLRGANSYISGTNGVASGSVPMLRVSERISIYVDQSGKRPGSNAIYLELWHPDIMNVVLMKREHGIPDNYKTPGIFYAMWICDEFMRTVKRETELMKNGRHKPLWYLICPTVCRLYDYYDEDFSTEYLTDEQVERGNYRFTQMYRKCIRSGGENIRCVSALEIYNEIRTTIFMTGVPYILFKDAVNRKSNQKNIGTIRGSNLCAEITIVNNSNETGVCNLASISLPKLVCDWDDGMKTAKKYQTNIMYMVNNTGIPEYKCINWKLLKTIVGNFVVNIDRIIDINYYPVDKAQYSNEKNRPIGIGVQGLADLFTILRIAFDSEEARELSAEIHERMYYYAVKKSCELARYFGAYRSYEGSPISKGIFQFDMWIKEQGGLKYKLTLGSKWDKLRGSVAVDKVRNSLFVATMPTATTSFIINNSACFEPHSSLFVKRKNKIGEFIIVNKYLIADLTTLGLWNDSVRTAIFNSRLGSIGNVREIPKVVRDLYKTSFEVAPIDLLRRAVACAPFIDQTMSLNLFLPENSNNLLAQLHGFAWKNGLKTANYYVRTLPASDSQKYTGEVCTMKEGCVSCSA